MLLSLERCRYTQTLIIHSCTPFSLLTGSLLTGSLLSPPQRCGNTQKQALLLEPPEVLRSLWYSWSSLGHPAAKPACDIDLGCYSPSSPFEGGGLPLCSVLGHLTWSTASQWGVLSTGQTVTWWLSEGPSSPNHSVTL